MFVATMESESYSWLSLGTSPEEAVNAILEKWNERQKYLVSKGCLHTANIMSVDELIEVYDITITEIEPGQCIYQ